MKRAPWIIGSLALLGAAACSSGGSGNTTGTGGGGAGATTSSSSTTTTSSSSGGTGLSGQGGSGGGPMYTTCDPFTALPCDVAAGQSCDWDGAAFSCFDPPNDVMLCGMCEPGAYCMVGMTCLDSSKCTPFCCDDGDCGAGATCSKTYIGDPNVGVCVATPSGTGGSDAGFAVTEPACNAPAQPPSMGACYKP